MFRKLRSEGVGTDVRHAPLVTPDEEDKLWESGVLNITTPKGLQRAVFFMWGNVFVFVEGRSNETWVHLISDFLLILDLIHTVLYMHKEDRERN